MFLQISVFLSLILTKWYCTKRTLDLFLQAQMAKSTMRAIQRSQEESCKEKWELCSLEVFLSTDVRTWTFSLTSAHLTFSRSFSHDAHFLPCIIAQSTSHCATSTCIIAQSTSHCWSSSVYVDFPQVVSYLHAGCGATAGLKSAPQPRNKIPMKQTILASTYLFYATEVRVVFTLRWIVRDWKGARGRVRGFPRYWKKYVLDPVLFPLGVFSLWKLTEKNI